MAKQTKKTNELDNTDETQETLSPQQLQQIADGVDHGVRSHSRREVEAKHGRETLLANEAAARLHRAKHGN